MSALGYYDIISELGRNVLIYPLDYCIIKGSSIDLSASRYAWSIDSGESLVQDDKIIIPPKQTAIVLTNETIYVSEKICGTYHPKVTLVSKGLSHIATTLDPYFIGISSISLTNMSDKAITITVGSVFVTIMLYYIKSPSKNTERQNSKDFIMSLNHCDNFEILRNWLATNNWIFEHKELCNKVTKSTKYKEIKDLYKYRNKFKYLFSNKNALPVITIVVLVLVSMLSYYFDYFATIVPTFLPLIVYCMIELFKNHNDK